MLGLQVVVATPGRLWELMQEGHAHLTDMTHLGFFVLDEADRMVQQGHFQVRLPCPAPFSMSLPTQHFGCMHLPAACLLWHIATWTCVQVKSFPGDMRVLLCNAAAPTLSMTAHSCAS